MRVTSPTAVLASLFTAAALVAACSSASRPGFVDEVPDGAAPVADGGTTPSPDTGVVATDSGTPVETDSGVVVDSGVACKTTAPSNKCGLFPQCKCTASETCEVLDLTGNVDCVAGGTADLGQACAGTGTCKPGLTCVFGACHSFCDTANMACTAPKSNLCYQVKNGPTTPVPNLKVCQITCDLRDATSCGAANAAGTSGCVTDEINKNTDCAKVGTTNVGQTCSATAICKPGTTCVTIGGATTCKTWCRVGVAGDCGVATCGGFVTKIMIGTVEYGVCP